jgi:hypothetical protein
MKCRIHGSTVWTLPGAMQFQCEMMILYPFTLRSIPLIKFDKVKNIGFKLSAKPTPTSASVGSYTDSNSFWILLAGNAEVAVVGTPAIMSQD